MGEEGGRKKGRGEGEGDENTSKFVLVLTQFLEKGLTMLYQTGDVQPGRVKQ